MSRPSKPIIPGDAALRSSGAIDMARRAGPVDVRQLIAETAKQFEGRITSATQGKEQAALLANEIGIAPERLIEALARGEGAVSGGEIAAQRSLLRRNGTQLRQLARQAASPEAAQADRLSFGRQLALHSALLEHAVGRPGVASRRLSPLRATATDDATQEAVVRGRPERSGFGGRRLAAMLARLDRPESLNAFVRQMSRAGSGESLILSWTNGLLTGSAERARDVLSRSLAAIWQISARTLGPGRRKGGLSALQIEAETSLFGTVNGFSDGLRLVGNAMRAGGTPDPLGEGTASLPQATAGTDFDPAEMGSLGLAADFLSVPLSSRFGMTANELSQAVGYRSKLWQRAYRQVNQEGLSGSQAVARIQELVDNPPEDLIFRATVGAGLMGYTEFLEGQGPRFHAVAEASPALTLFSPVFRSTANLAKSAGKNTGPASHIAVIRADLAAGGARSQVALARLESAKGIVSVLLNLAASGVITSQVPSASQSGDAKRQNGEQSSSIRVGDRFVAYDRQGSLGATLGMAADLAEVMGQLDQAEADEAALAVVLTVYESVADKSFLLGMADVVEALAAESPEAAEARIGRPLQTLLSSGVPRGRAQIGRPQSAVVRDATRIVRQTRSRVPGVSTELPPPLNMWGEPVQLSPGLGPKTMSPLLPSSLAAEDGNRASEELRRLEVPVSMPARSIIGVALKPEEYNRYVTLAGNELKDPETGLGLRDTIEALLDGRHPLAKQYQQADDNEKVLLIRQTIQDFRSDARAQLMQEFPDLRAAIRSRENAVAGR